MVRALRLSVLMTSMALASTVAASPQSSSARVSSEFIYDHAPFPSAHSSTIVETRDGLVAVWFGGTAEGRPDVGIWLSRRDRTGWTVPVEVANGLQPDGTRRPCWNPVLFQPSNGPLLLFYKVGPNPREWWGLVRTSTDGGRTWSAAIRLPDKILGPIRAKPVELSRGVLLAGSSTEHDGWVMHLERLTVADWKPETLSSARSWESIGPLNDAKIFGAIQPTILVHSPTTLQILCRSYNPISTDRHKLEVAVSDDGEAWRSVAVLEDSPGDYSYPAMIQTRDGLVHVTYTWQRERIRHAVIDLRRAGGAF